MKAICIGHAAYDITLPVEKYPTENIKYRIDNHIECGGGPASNAAYLLAKWHINTSFVGSVGNDFYGHKIEEEFKEIGVNIKYLEISNDLKTASSYIIANTSNGTRTIITSKDSRKTNLIKKTVFLDADVILADGEEVDAAEDIIKRLDSALSILDAGTLKDETIRLGKVVDYLACSKNFAEDFTNKKIDVKNIEELTNIHKSLETYFDTNVIITLEDKGTFIKSDTYQVIPSIKVKAVDSTGAGDIFHGALAYFLGNHYKLDEAVRLSNIAGALSVEKIGSRYAIPSLEEVLKKGEESEVI